MDPTTRALLAKMIWPKDNQTAPPDRRSARDLLLGRLTDPLAYNDPWPKDTNRDLNRWAALKVAFAGLDVPWFTELEPTNPGLGNWRWRDKPPGAKRAPGSQNIPCHENATKLFLAFRRGKNKAVEPLLKWWQDWGTLMQRRWMGDELMSREYGPTVAEAVHAVLELYGRRGDDLGANVGGGLASEVRRLLDTFLNRWYFENALRAVPWIKADMLTGPRAGRTNLKLSIAAAGLRSAPSFRLAYQAEPMLALMLDWPVVAPKALQKETDPRAWSDYPVDDRIAIPALSAWRPAEDLLRCAEARLGKNGPDHGDFWDSSVCFAKAGQDLPTVTGYHTAVLEGGGLVSWIDEDTNHETVPALVYAILPDGKVEVVYPVGKGPKPHRKVPPSRVQREVRDGKLTLTVLQDLGGEAKVFETRTFEGIRGLDGRPEAEIEA